MKTYNNNVCFFRLEHMGLSMSSTNNGMPMHMSGTLMGSQSRSHNLGPPPKEEQRYMVTRGPSVVLSTSPNVKSRGQSPVNKNSKGCSSSRLQSPPVVGIANKGPSHPHSQFMSTHHHEGGFLYSPSPSLGMGSKV